MKIIKILIVLICVLFLPTISMGQDITKNNLSLELLQKVFTDSSISCSIAFDEQSSRGYLEVKVADDNFISVYLDSAKEVIEFFTYCYYKDEATRDELDEYIEKVINAAKLVDPKLNLQDRSIDFQFNLKIKDGITYEYLIWVYWSVLDDLGKAFSLDEKHVLK
jgi:hypothetical protein